MATVISNNDKTLLNVPSAHIKYVKSHGASFDKRAQQWFVLGDVPDALLPYVIKSARSRDYTKENVPSCPKCHAGMVLRFSRTNEWTPFWGCSRHFVIDCKGARPLEESMGDTQWQRAPQPLFEPKAEHSSLAECDDENELRQKVTETLVLCRLYLPHGNQWKVWLHTPRLRFGNRSALDILTTIEGCQDVQALLNETFEDA